MNIPYVDAMGQGLIFRHLDHHDMIGVFIEFCCTFIQSFRFLETYHINSDYVAYLGSWKQSFWNEKQQVNAIVLRLVQSWWIMYVCYIPYARFLFNSMWWNILVFVPSGWPIMKEFTALASCYRKHQRFSRGSTCPLLFLKMKFCLMNVIYFFCYLGTLW